MALLAPDHDSKWLLVAAKQIEARFPQRRTRKLAAAVDLYALGLSLMQQAESIAQSRGRVTTPAALAYRDGLLIALLTAVAPLRRRGLTALTLGDSVLKSGSAWSITLPAEDNKSNRGIEYGVPDRIAAYLERYVDVFRPMLMTRGTHAALWTSRHGGRASEGAIYRAVIQRTRAALGHGVHLHLFRHIAASFAAEHAPSDVRAAADLLGHQNHTTTERHYIHAQGIAAHRLLATIIGERQKSILRRPIRGTTARPTCY
jgi:site-specific recombinase XerD